MYKLATVLDLDCYSLHMDFLLNHFWVRVVTMKRHSFIEGEHFDLVRMPLTLSKTLIIKDASLKYHDKWQNSGLLWQIVDIVGTDLEIKDRDV